jgi:hypothetical protein
MRTMFPLSSAVAITVLAFGSAACSIDVHGEGVVTREEKRFTLSGEPNLSLRTFDGSIQLKSWDRNEVLVEIERRGPDQQTAESLVVDARQDGNRIVVEAPAPRDRREVIHIGSRQSPSVNLIVTVPWKVTADARTGDGSMTAEDLVGAVVLNSGDGSIRARRVEGDLRVRTGDGSIAVADAVGRVEADSGDGSIELAGRLEALDVRTGDGSVRLDVFDGSAMRSDWSVNTGDGSISVRLPRNLDAEIDAHTGDGGVHASGPSVSAERGDDREENRDSLRARIGKGGRTLRLRSGDGSISISH